MGGFMMKEVLVGFAIVVVAVLIATGVAHIIHCSGEHCVTQLMNRNVENVTEQEACDVGRCGDVKCAMKVVCSINNDSRACDLTQLRYVTCMSNKNEEKNK